MNVKPKPKPRTIPSPGHARQVEALNRAAGLYRGGNTKSAEAVLKQAGWVREKEKAESK